MITSRSFIIWKIDILYYLVYFNPQVFQGNVDDNSIVHHDFAPLIVARFLRVHPKTWHNYISMRIEIYGCIWKGDPLLHCLLTSILPLHLAIVFRIKLSGNAEKSKRLIMSCDFCWWYPESGQIFCFTPLIFIQYGRRIESKRRCWLIVSIEFR